MGYCLKQGLKNIYRNRIFSLASIATMSLCIFLFGIFFSILMNISHMVDEASNSVCVTVFFDKGISEERIQSIGNSIEKRSEVASIHFTSAEEAWNNFKQDYFKDYSDLAADYDNDNPLVNCESYEIYLTDSSQQSSLVNYLQGVDGIRSIKKSDITANSLTDIRNLVGMVSVITLVILFSVALFLISNTIAIGVTVRTEEITIMKLLGARNMFVRAPFIVEGVIIGTVGALLPLIAVYYVYDSAVSYILLKFTFLANVLSFLSVRSVFKNLIPIALILGIGIGFLGSCLTLRKRLKA